MKEKLFSTSFILVIILLAVSCGGSVGSNDKTIKSTKSGEWVVTLSGPGGVVKEGKNELTLNIADANGKGVDAGPVILKFHMNAMGSMAEMNDSAVVTAAGQLGKYKVSVNVESAGPWEVQVSYNGSSGPASVRMPVDVIL